MQDDELDRFKRDINLVQYALERHGFVRVPRESSRSSHALRHEASGDKILVTRQADGHWVYCSVRDDRDCGTIVEFIQRRSGHSLGRVRNTLRSWLGTSRPDPGPECRPPTPPVRRDREAVDRAYRDAEPTDFSAYLHSRGLRPVTLRNSRFANRWKVDRHRNVLFPHEDERGLCGFEVKNHGFTGFATGGRKAFWQSTTTVDDQVLVIAESAIDAMSYQQLFGTMNSRYVSSAGTLSADQLQRLDRIAANLDSKLTVVAAIDSDAGGDALALQIRRIAEAHCLPFERHSPDPEQGKDWNEILQRHEREFIRGPRTRTGLEIGR
jgi:hypothetical protein